MTDDAGSTVVDAAAIDRAASALAAGELVAFPTETVYGLGARADDDAAVAKIFALKGRPAGHPLIVHVADRTGAERFAARCRRWPSGSIDAFWPGPLTVIVRAPARHGRGRCRRPGDDRPALPGASGRARPARERRASAAWPASPRRAPTASAGSARPPPAHVVDEFGDDAAGARRRCGAARHRVGDRRLLARPAGAAAPGRADARAASRRRAGEPLRRRRRRRAARPGTPRTRTTRRARSCA